MNVEARWERLVDRWATDGYESLSPDEKIWLNIRQLIDSTQNGGLISYFFNPGADTYSDCPGALSLLGAQEVREQVEKVASLFPGGVPQSIEARNEVIDSWADDPKIEELLEEVDETLMGEIPNLESRLEDYLRRSGELSN